MTSLSATPPASPGGSLAVPAPTCLAHSAPSVQAPSGSIEGAFIRLVQPWVVRCASPTLPGGALPPQPAGTGDAPADASLECLSWGSGAGAGAAEREMVQFEVCTSQALASGVNELVISFNGHMLLRHDCSGKDAAAGLVRVSLPAPDTEGVWQVRRGLCLLQLHFCGPCNRSAW